jgi:glycosyltransferase involved in cell wall biosynthesis
MRKTILVVPCYNEAKRLQAAPWVEIGQTAQTSFLFVDDGSKDSTLATLESIAAELTQNKISVEILRLPQNVGKGKAVHQGVLKALQSAPDCVGYVDADLSTPAHEISRLLQMLQDSEDSLKVLMGSRIQRLGASVERKTLRHYVGRVFATCASIVLRMSTYDTQCGAKFFKVTDPFKEALSVPFLSRWAFDVELIARLKQGYGVEAANGGTLFLEEPLRAWRDIEGSKLSMMGSLRAFLDLLRIKLRY